MSREALHEHTHEHDHETGHVHTHAHVHDHEEERAHSHEHTHTHDHEGEHAHSHEHVHDHEGEHTHPHEHKHVHQNTKAVLNRLSKAIGHLEKVRQMVEDGEDCSEVLIQLAAVRSALNNTGKIILKDHIDHCIVDAVECGDTKALEDMNKAIERFM